MIECVNPNPAGLGSGCCFMCLVMKGFSNEWSSSLYYIKNAKGLYLRCVPYGSLVRTAFIDDDEFRRVVFCYAHALQVEEARKNLTTWNKGE